jgi:UrcA family protein
MKTLLLVAATFAVIICMGPAKAAPKNDPFPANSTRPVNVLAHTDTVTRIVPYGDLSLATRKGRRTLMRRVDVAVDQVCPEYDKTSGQFYTEIAECKHFAWTGASPQIKQAFDRALSGETLSAATSVIAVAGQ